MMPIQPVCLPCVINQSHNYLLRFSSPEKHLQVMQKVLEKISRANLKELNMPELASEIYQMIDKECQLNDPFKKEKQEANLFLLKRKEQLQAEIRKKDFPLKEALKLSAMGNMIDLGIHDHHFDISELLNAESLLSFAIDDSHELIQDLKNAKNLVFIFDNSGEAILDRILCEEIKKEFPKIHITAIVRGAPILNDVTPFEAEQIRLKESVDQIQTTGASIPGISFGISPEQDQTILQADVVIAKGLGNFESNRFKRKIYHLFKVKCRAISDYIRVEIGEIVLSAFSA